MNYKEYNDGELLMLIKEEHEDAKNILFDKYYYIIDIIIKKYNRMGLALGIEYKDLYQEAMVGFADALNRYDENKEASLPTFISLCVERRVQAAIIKAGRQKNKIYKDVLSLDHEYPQYESTLAELISDDNKNDPLRNITDAENYQQLAKLIDDSLSKGEKDVYQLMKQGFDYKQIADILKKDSKSIDNAMQRIKNKVRRIVEERNKVEKAS
jgi:RNA polymerase sporulation-specific sigma factor